MGFLTDSARKINSYFSSSPPKTVLGKRKTVSFEDEESDASLDYYNDAPLEYDSDASADSAPDSVRSDDGRPSREEVDCFSDDYKKPLPSTKRIVTSAKVTRSRNGSFMQPNSVLRKTEQGLHEKYIQKQDIQKNLKEESRQEHIAIVEPQKKRATPGRTKTASVTRHVTFEQTAGTSKSKPEPALKAFSPKAPARKDSAHVSKSTTPMAQWADKPNTRARETIEDNWYSRAAILDDLKEPEYACRDVEIRDRVWRMMDQIEGFAKEHFTIEVKDKKRLRAAFESMPKETVEIIGCVASGGPAGASGWEDLFINSDKRQALVCAIIGNVVVEQIFQHMFFGGTEEQIKEVSEIQYSHRNHDGFDRNKLYADKIRSFLHPNSAKGKAAAGTPSSLHLPVNFAAHTTHITAALLTHLKPILSLHHLTPATQFLALAKLVRSLHPITIHAGLLSLSMRLDSHTVYHLAPVFKEQPFTACSMVCTNHAAMISTHPRGNGDKDGISHAEQDRRATLSKEEVQRMQHDQGLVQITLFPGLTAYRLGGWETASSQPYAETKKVDFEQGCEGAGVRCRPLTDAWVYCRWGRQRVWQDGKPADKGETHGVAWKGGFVEFFPGIQGVFDPDPERTKRIEARKTKEKQKQEAAEVVESEGGDEDEDV